MFVLAYLSSPLHDGVLIHLMPKINVTDRPRASCPAVKCFHVFVDAGSGGVYGRRAPATRAGWHSRYRVITMVNGKQNRLRGCLTTNQFESAGRQLPPFPLETYRITVVTTNRIYKSVSYLKSSFLQKLKKELKNSIINKPTTVIRENILRQT